MGCTVQEPLQKVEYRVSLEGLVEGVARELCEVKQSLDEVAGWLEGKTRYNQGLHFKLHMALVGLERAKTMGSVFQQSHGSHHQLEMILAFARAKAFLTNPTSANPACSSGSTELLLASAE